MNKKTQINLLNRKSKIIIWIRKISILYNLFIFSKKRLKYNFIHLPSDLIFILLLPLLGYTLDNNIFLYNKSNSEFFFKKTLPGLNNFNIILSSNLNWDTFNYTEYFKKINWNKLNKINYFDNSIFICFNSNFYNKHFYIGTTIEDKKNININELVKITNENKFNKNIKQIQQNRKSNLFFISGRLFNRFFQPYLYNTNLLYNYKYKNNSLNLNIKTLKTNYFKKLQNWQAFFYELDYIPIKLDNIFFFNINNLNSNLINKDLNKDLNKPLFNNLFFYFNETKSNVILDSKLNELKKRKIIKSSNSKTLIEEQTKRLKNEMFTKQTSSHLWNFRFFHYKIYNKFFLFKYFLKNQINNFNSNKKTISTISSLVLKKTNTINNFETKSIEKNTQFYNAIENQKEPNWKNLLRKDLKNLGNTKTDKFLHFNKIKLQFNNSNDFEENNLNFKYNQNKQKNLLFLKDTIKNPISLDNRENKYVLPKSFDNKQNVQNKKLYTITKNNKKYSFIPSLEREFFYYLNTLIKKNKSLDLKTYSDKIIFFIFKNTSFKTVVKQNVNQTNYYLKKQKLLKNRIIETNSDLLKRKMSGYLYPDTNKKKLLFINKFGLFNNSFIKIQGQKNLIYKYFKKFYNDLFFLYSKPNIIDFNIEQNNYKNVYLKNKNTLIKTKFFFGYSKMDFGLAFNYDKQLNIKSKKENDKIYYKPNLNLIYNKRRLDTKIPFSYDSIIKDELIINYNYYYKSLLLNTQKNVNFSFNKEFNNVIKNSKIVEMNDFNNLSLFPISYKSHFEYNKNYDSINIPYSNFIKNFKNTFNSDLYEIIKLKKFSLLIQILFLLIFLKLINNLKDNYGQSFLIAFKTFFNNFEFDALTNLKIDAGQTIKSKKIKFNTLIGGKIFLQEFNQTILLLKNSKYGFQSHLNIIKPNFTFNLNNKLYYLYSNNNKYYINNCININNKQKTFIYNFIYNPFYLLSLNFRFKKLKNKIINNNSFIINLKTTINIKGFLLVGPPGTGKTLLVKALSGESDVPIILESGEKLSKFNFDNETMSENAKGALRLKNLFNRAKKLSPCILFLDEIDNVGQNRKDVLTDYRKQNLKNYSTTNSLYFLSHNKINMNLLNVNKFNINNNVLNLKKKITNNNNNNQLNSKSLSMLTQLLCELDGLKNRQDLVIVGATNRPKTLDPALTRPGRLNKIIYIDLPGKKKRFELLNFYLKNNVSKNINWEFFTNQTTGLSAAHLSSAVNISLLNKIYNFKQQQYSKLVNINKTQNLKKEFLIQNFENLEYGIQSIKFKNSSFKYKYSQVGLLINNLIINFNYYNQLKLINLFNFSNFFLIYYNLLYKKNNNQKLFKKWVNTKKIKLTKLKKNLRTIFYKKNKKFIRYLYLLNKKNNSKSFFIKIKNYYILKNFYKYIIRLFKVNIFSCSMLMLATYTLNNPLIVSFNFLYSYLKFKINTNYNIIQQNKLILTLNNNFLLFKYNNILKYKLINYNFKLTNHINFVIKKKFFHKDNNIFSINKKFKINNRNTIDVYDQNVDKKQLNVQKLVLNDSNFINRSSYYLGGKILLLNVLKQSITNVNYFNLWLMNNSFETNKTNKYFFTNIFIKKLINKKEFENYLLFNIAGKISEIKFLFNNNLSNFSSIAINDLKEIGWLLNIMINKSFFYKTLKLKLFKQVLIQDLKNCIKINNNKKIKSQNSSNIKFEYKLLLLKSKLNKTFLFNNKKRLNIFNSQKMIFWDLIPYWWEPNLKIQNFNTIYWSFSKSKKLNLLPLLYKTSFKYTYYCNFINNKLNVLKNKNVQLGLNKNLNTIFLNNFFKSGICWNDLLVMDYYILMSNIIFTITNKIFILLHINNELLDYFSYYILCNTSSYDFELNNIFLKYYSKNKR